MTVEENAPTAEAGLDQTSEDDEDLTNPLSTGPSAFTVAGTGRTCEFLLVLFAFLCKSISQLEILIIMDSLLGNVIQLVFCSENSEYDPRKSL